MKARLKWNKNVLAAKRFFLFHFIRGSVLK